ncbi:hypothetical protein DXG01_002336 [Tephrocybe rancida]|nr:hypothetical protein DXG01_002336 [Tephrocybe rancida]
MPKAPKPSTESSRKATAQAQFLKDGAPYFNQTKGDKREHTEFLERFYQVWWDRWPLEKKDFFDAGEMEFIRGKRNQDIHRRIMWAASCNTQAALNGPWREYVTVERDRDNRKKHDAHLAALPRPKPRPAWRKTAKLDRELIGGQGQDKGQDTGVTPVSEAATVSSSSSNQHGEKKQTSVIDVDALYGNLSVSYDLIKTGRASLLSSLCAMARTAKYKFIEHKTRLPPRGAQSRLRNRGVEHNCYASQDGLTTSSTSFVKVNVPEMVGEVQPPASGILSGEANINPGVAYDLAYLEHLDEVEEDIPKRRRTASDDPLRMWLPFRDLYLQELINMDGRGDRPTDICLDCTQFPANRAVYECFDCCGRRMRCQQCIVIAHSENPFHSIQSHTAQLLRARLFPATVINPKTAATFSLLKTFELLSYKSKVSAFQFYHTLSRLTDNTGLNPPKDRYMALLVMIREWRHLKMLKRAERGHEKNGIATTKPGSCVVECPACPIAGKNMVEGWRDTPANKKFIHALFVGIDANFRLKRRDVSSNDLDPSLGDGFAYFVKEGPYKEHLEKHKNEVEPKSNCSRHDAMNLANSKPSQGLAATGVGTIKCARHDMKRPCSVGDLQVGERYCNMDYLFYQSVINSDLESYVISYDIACQWSVHLRERMFKLDHEFFMFDGSIHVQFFVPKFHLSAHVMACHTSFSFNYGVGVGRTDGEAPERGWAEINPLASSTKEMGPGSRRDALDSHFADYNWRKITGLGRSLLRKFKAATVDLTDHVTAHFELNTSLPRDLLLKWTTAVEAWERDPSQPNPLVSIVDTPTQAAVRRELAQAEASELGTTAEYSLDDRVSPSVLISCGLDLEAEQRSLAVEAQKIWNHSQDRQRTKLQLRSNTLQRKIAVWSNIQQLYIPGVSSLRRVEEHQAAAKKKPLTPYTLSLFLPSQIGSKLPVLPHLVEVEWKLRIAQAYEALDALRHNLQIWAHLFKFKDRFIRGQHANTRARGAIDTVQARIDAAASEYRAAHKALDSLSTVSGDTSWRAQLLPLQDIDIREMSEAEDDRTSEGRRRISWIWKMLGVIGDHNDSEELRDALRIEWCKSRARAMRFSEEVELLTEEMGRVLSTPSL